MFFYTSIIFPYVSPTRPVSLENSNTFPIWPTKLLKIRETKQDSTILTQFQFSSDHIWDMRNG